MKSLFLASLICALTNAATTDMLFERHEYWMDGRAGNVVTAGDQFVTPVVSSGNGAIRLAFLDTNAAVVSNLSLSITGRSPRVTFDGGYGLVAWINTNNSPATLSYMRFTDGPSAIVSTIATNPACFSTRAVDGKFFFVWESTDVPTVSARWLSN